MKILLELSEELAAEIDKKRGDVPRVRWIRNTLSAALNVPCETIHKPTERAAHNPVAVVDGMVAPKACDHQLWNGWSARCPTCQEKLR
jgi:hypothetical protein